MNTKRTAAHIAVYIFAVTSIFLIVTGVALIASLFLMFVALDASIALILFHWVTFRFILGVSGFLALGFLFAKEGQECVNDLEKEL